MSTVKGKKWHRIRTVLSPSFSALKLKRMVPLMNQACDTLMKKLEKVADVDESCDIHKYIEFVLLMKLKKAPSALLNYIRTRKFLRTREKARASRTSRVFSKIPKCLYITQQCRRKFFLFLL